MQQLFRQKQAGLTIILGIMIVLIACAAAMLIDSVYHQQPFLADILSSMRTKDVLQQRRAAAMHVAQVTHHKHLISYVTLTK